MSNDNIDQDEIDNLLNQPSGDAGDAAQPPSPQPSDAEADDALNQDEIEALLKNDGDAAAPDDSSSPEETPAAESAPPQPSGISQDDVEALLKKQSEQEPAPAATTSDESNAPIPQGDIDFLLQQAEGALASAQGESASLPSGVSKFELKTFGGAAANEDTATLDLIRDVELDVRIELGRTHMYLEDVLRLSKGSVVPLEKLAGDPVDVYVNGRLVARGEVLVLNDNFCVRVAELIVGESARAS